jgi:hypothetical protein
MKTLVCKVIMPDDQLPDPKPPLWKTTRGRAQERHVRAYAYHLGLRVRRRGGVLELHEKYDAKRKIGTCRTWEAMGRAIEQANDDMLKELQD